MSGPTLLHVTTTAMSLDWLLGPQLQAFAAAGYDVIGASGADDEDRHVEALRAAGIEHVRLAHATRAMAPHRDVLAMTELLRLFRHRLPDIVHTHNPKPGIYGRLAARAAGVPHVVNTVHGLYATPEDRWARRQVVYGLERVAARASDAELVQNEEDLETLAGLGVPRHKLHLLGNGIDLARFDPDRFGPDVRAARRAELGAGPGDVVVGVVGRLVREKGYGEVLAAATALRSLAPAAKVVVVGPTDPDKADALDATAIAAAQADGIVRFLGARDDVDELYTAFDLYVLASWREGFPRSAMEAAAMGLPIVATDIRGCRQVVDNGGTGWLVPVRDAVALTEAVRSLVADPARRAAMGVAARRRAIERFDQQRVIDLSLATYEQLLARRADPR